MKLPISASLTGLRFIIYVWLAAKAHIAHGEGLGAQRDDILSVKFICFEIKFRQGSQGRLQLRQNLKVVRERSTTY